MRVDFRTVRLTKRYPLQISRGTSTGSDNLFVFLSDGSLTGVGEGAPSVASDAPSPEDLRSQLAGFLEGWPLEATSVWETERAMREAVVDPVAMAALDTAAWDLLAKRAGLPLHALFGLPRPSVPTSVTVGINPPDLVRERAEEILARTGAKALKVKLGNPAGRDADRDQYEAARSAAAPFGARLRADANGGWTVGEARAMMAWLADRDCDYVEQPLAAGEEGGLAELMPDRALPIYLDESIRTARDVVEFAGLCDGVNLKLMKTGGLTEAMRLVATARAHRLGTMIGCMGESSVAIAAGCSIGALFDHIDLDSHLNLAPDPAHGLRMENGIVLADEAPGHGAALTEPA